MRWLRLDNWLTTSNKKGRAPLWRWLALGAGVAVLVAGSYYLGRSQSPAGMSGESQQSVELYAEALNLVQKEYVDQEELDPGEQAHAAIEGMLGSLGDQGHTRLLTPEEAERNEQSISGRYVGVGVTIEERDGEAVVSSPTDGSPADEAGIQSGDVIVAVNGENVEDENLSRIAERVRGEEGTTVDLTLRRDEEEREFTLERSEIDVSAASWAMIPETETAHLRLSTFSSESADELEEALNEARQAGAQRYVLDLRDNAGGRLDQAVAVAELFLEPGSVVYIRQDAEGNREKIRTSGGSDPAQAPMTVLVNGGTASSAEILAGALRDNERAEVVGVGTFGTGTVLKPYELDDGSKLLLGIAEWLTPDGDFIREGGIEPSVQVELEEGQEPLTPDDEDSLSRRQIMDRDAQLERAFELVRQK